MTTEQTIAISTSLDVTGMSCANCARHVTDALQSVPGVASANVQLEARRASVRWKPGSTPQTNALISAVEKAGYEAAEIVPKQADAPAHDHVTHDHGESFATQDHGSHHAGGLQANLLVGVLVTVPLLLADGAFRVGTQSWFHWIAFPLSGVVQFYAGAQFYKGAWRQLRVGQSNMDALV